ncbi:AAA family ATPase [Vogesella sp. LIG4]|uniref:AAA family ATPase n=1 Tax=Vogesella sp. LIG4 TaxID=1192162 RepID=UPI00081FF1FD|nr:AAA family ATPase [Vogesella sp. LIG4]SCK11610.1 AAA domain-containing protein, putative AbiEii toxin, Type IV TA system [Vogesella sp. LIG4]
MEFLVQRYNAPAPSVDTYPHCLLKQDNWDDYSSKTLFRLTYIASPSEKLPLGSIKIMSNRVEDYDPQGFVLLPDSFKSLDENFASLGQELGFYEDLAKDTHLMEQILTSLNDLVYNQGIVEDFENLAVFKNSLIRFSEAEQAFRQGNRLLIGQVSGENSYDFSFECKVGSASQNHKAKFIFDGTDVIPGRIVAIIGGNGTGKTQFLAKMALALSGESESGRFQPNRPSFSKIIAVSYSAFDKFERPNKKRTFSYIYCGLKDNQGFLTAKKLESRYENSAAKLTLLRRERLWFDVLKNLIDENHLLQISEDLFDKKIFSRVAHNSDGLLSSGQSIIMYIVTEILANIRSQSLILFDEPEMHLHPSAIAKLIIIINTILQHFDSYALLATHSPLILQEVPSKYVKVFDRVGSIPIVRDLDMECFGENITVITKHVFETVATEPNYKKVLRQLSSKYTASEVNEIFKGELSLNASIFLQALYDGE